MVCVTGVPRCDAAEMRGGPAGLGFPGEVGKAGIGDSSQETDLDNSPGRDVFRPVSTHGLKRGSQLFH